MVVGVSQLPLCRFASGVVGGRRGGEGLCVVVDSVSCSQGVLWPDARDPIAQVGRQSRDKRRRQEDEAQETEMRHFVGRRRALREGLSCSSLVLRRHFVTEASRLHVIFYVKPVIFYIEIQLHNFYHS